jgi:PAS domain S-box-containing protein
MTTKRALRPIPPPLADRSDADGETTFRMLVERGHDVFYRLRLGPEPALVYVSPAIQAVTGYAPEEVYADPGLWQQLVHPDDRANLPGSGAIDAEAIGDVEAPVTVRLVHRDGTIRWTEHRTVAVHDAAGRVVAIEGTARDITAQAEAQLRVQASEAQFLDLLSNVELGTLVLDATGRVEFINDFLLALLGRRRDELLGQDWIDVAVPDGERVDVRAALVAAFAAGVGVGRREDGIVTRSGDVRRLLWTSVIRRDASGAAIGMAGIAYEVTEARRVEAERAQLATAIDQATESVVVTDRDARIVYVNRAFERISGYRSDEVLGRNPRIVKSGLQSETFYDAMWAALSNGLPWVADVVNRRKDGTLYSLSSAMSAVRDADGSITGFVDVGRDVTRERELETRADLLARERALIGETLRSLPRDADVAIEAELFCRQVVSLTGVTTATLIAFDPDGAAVPLAYVAPDADATGLRRLTAGRSRYLQDHAASGPWVEEWVDDPTHPYADSMRLLGVRALACTPIRSGGGVTGILAVGSAEPDAVALLSSHLGGLVDFSDLAGALLGPRIADRREVSRLRARIEGVIAERAFGPVFQPIVDIRHDRVVGHEALTRFVDGARPDLRFADAAAVGLGTELELVTLEAALDAARGAFSPSRWLSLNVSPELVLARPELGALLRASRARIMLEITEHAAVDDYRAFREALVAIGRPVCLAVDDAGAGFASLRHILELEPAIVKLDVSLIRGLDADPAKQALVAGMRHFARTTGRRLIAEGVETPEEAATLNALDIRLGQGYLFGRPVPARR